MVGRGGSGQLIAVLNRDGPANYSTDVRFANIITQLDFQGQQFYTQKTRKLLFSLTVKQRKCIKINNLATFGLTTELMYETSKVSQRNQTWTQCKIEFTYQSQKPLNFKVVQEW